MNGFQENCNGCARNSSSQHSVADHGVGPIGGGFHGGGFHGGGFHGGGFHGGGWGGAGLAVGAIGLGLGLAAAPYAYGGYGYPYGMAMATIATRTTVDATWFVGIRRGDLAWSKCATNGSLKVVTDYGNKWGGPRPMNHGPYHTNPARPNGALRARLLRAIRVALVVRQSGG